MKIYSELGQGTTVKIYLPRLLADDDDGESGRPGDTTPVGERTQTILVVEDDDDVRAHSAEILRELGYRVLEAPNAQARAGDPGAATRDRAAVHRRRHAGGMNGRQLADEAPRRRPGLKVLYTTGYAQNAIVHDGGLDPGVQLITKPFS